MFIIIFIALLFILAIFICSYKEIKKAKTESQKAVNEFKKYCDEIIKSSQENIEK